MRHRRPSRTGAFLFWATIVFLVGFIAVVLGVAIGLRFL